MLVVAPVAGKLKSTGLRLAGWKECSNVRQGVGGEEIWDWPETKLSERTRVVLSGNSLKEGKKKINKKGSEESEVSPE